MDYMTNLWSKIYHGGISFLIQNETHASGDFLPKMIQSHLGGVRRTGRKGWRLRQRQRLKQR